MCVWVSQPTRHHDRVTKSCRAHIQDECLVMFKNICLSERMFEVFQAMFEVCPQCLSCLRPTVSHFGMFVNICSRIVR